MARKNSNKGSHPKAKNSLAEKSLLDSLASDEASAVLHGFLVLPESLYFLWDEPI
jgi:hypothetical protein